MSGFTIVIDSREQLPYRFEGYETVVEKLETGDYSVVGFENVFAVERKSLSDFLKSITWERKRFKKEIERGDDLLGFVVVIESSVQDILNWNYKRKVHPNSVMGTVNNWEEYHSVEFEWAGDRSNAEQQTIETLERWYSAYSSMYNSTSD